MGAEQVFPYVQRELRQKRLCRVGIPVSFARAVAAWTHALDRMGSEVVAAEACCRGRNSCAEVGMQVRGGPSQDKNDGPIISAG